MKSANPTPLQQNMNDRIFDLALGRVFKRVYLELSAEKRKEMETVFLSDEESEKEDFLKENIKNFRQLLPKK